MGKMYVMLPEKKGTIAPEIYGHFTEHIGGVIYDGIWVGKDSKVPNYEGFRKDIVDKLRRIKAPVFRWPGGCFAEAYDWHDGIGENRPTRTNWWTERDGKYESNEYGTHEFFRFCELVGAKAYMAANITSQTPMDMRNYMDYCISPKGTTTLARLREKNGHSEPFDVSFWGIGNENWGGGGNMTPELYADEYKRYSMVVGNINNKVKYISCGQASEDYSWTRRFLEKLQTPNFVYHIMKGMSVHYYCGTAGDALNYSNDEWYLLLKKAGVMNEIIERTWGIVRGTKMESKAKLVIDEWGCWHPDGSGPSKGGNLYEQQSTMRDALVTALTLNIFNNNCDKVMMANAAQLVNNLHCLFFSSGDKCITTPTFHVFDMFKNHMGAECVNVAADTKSITFKNGNNDDTITNLSYSASVKDGVLTLTVANLGIGEDEEIDLQLVGGIFAENTGTLTTLVNTDIHAHNTFEEPEAVKPESCEINLSEPVIIPKGGLVTISAKII